MNNQLVSYITDVKHKYNIDTIKNTLIQTGYTIEQIEEALIHIEKKELSEYIKRIRNKGHSVEKIRTHLKKFGYNEEKISSAFALINQIEEDVEKIEKKSIPLFVIAIIIVGGALTSSFFLLGGFDLLSYECEGLDFGIYSIDDQKVLCTYPDDSKLQIILENSGSVMIPQLKLDIIGESKLVQEYDDFSLEPDGVVTKLVDVDIGKVKKIIITPFILQDNKLKVCTGNKITATEFDVC